MNPVITFNKNYEERLQEYTVVFRTDDSSVVSASDLHKKWVSYLQINIDCACWLAIWKIPRWTCKFLNIEFPVTALVYVENVDFPRLSASIKTLIVGEDVFLSNKHFVVSLIELWPTKQQEQSVEYNMNATANAMDMLRIFYIYLFMPWDLEEDANTDWVTEHLETRLTLFYDMRSGDFPKYKAAYIRELLTEARHLHSSQKNASEDCKDTGIRVRMANIKTEIEILEDPLLRNAVLRQEQAFMSKKPISHGISLVLPSENNISNYICFLNEVRAHIGSENVQYKSCLGRAMADAGTHETILLSKGTHTFDNLCSLEEGGVFKGLYNKEDTIITSSKEHIMFDTCGNLTFENLTIDVPVAQLGILVRRGVVTLNNCKLISSSRSQNGVTVIYGSTLNVNDCDIQGFDKAIIVNSGSILHLKDSSVSNVNVGLMLYSDSCITVEFTKFQNCKDCGIDVEIDAQLEKNLTGGFEMLQMPTITLNNVSGEGNGTDCCISEFKKIDLVEDVLSVQTDSSSDDDMDTTVLTV